MPKLYKPQLPDDADEATRLAHASFAAVVALAEVMKATNSANADAIRLQLKMVGERYGVGDGAAAEWIRDSFGD